MEKVCTADAPTAKKKGGMGSVDVMLEKEEAVENLQEGYSLPLDDTAAAALRFTVADQDVTWQIIYQQCHSQRLAGKGTPNQFLAANGAIANALPLMLADVGSVAQPEAACSPAH